MSIFDLLNLPADVTVLLYSIGVVLILAYFFAGKDFGIFKIPAFDKGRERPAGLSGVVILLACIVAGLPLFDKSTDSDVVEKDPKPLVQSDERIFAVGGSLKDFNEIGILSGYNSRVVRGGNQTITLEFREDVDVASMSCFQIHFCKPVSANSCSTVKRELRPLNGHKNSFSFPIFDSYEPGTHRVHVKLIRVQNPQQLVPAKDGSYALSDYQLYGESREFEVADPG